MELIILFLFLILFLGVIYSFLNLIIYLSIRYSKMNIIINEYRIEKKNKNDLCVKPEAVWDFHINNVSFKSTFRSKIINNGLFIEEIFPGMFKFVKPIYVPFESMFLSNGKVFVKTSKDVIPIRFYRPEKLQDELEERLRTGETEKN